MRGFVQHDQCGGWRLLSIVLFFLWKLVCPSLARLSAVCRRTGIVTSRDNLCPQMTGVCAWWVYVPFSVFVVHVNSETKGFDNALKQQISRASVGTGPATLSVVRGSALARDTGQAKNLHSTASLNRLLSFLVMALKPFLRRNVSEKAFTGSVNSSDSSLIMAFLMSALHIISHCTVSNAI